MTKRLLAGVPQVSGNEELRKRTGATVFIGANAGALYPHYPVCDGDTFVLSSRYAFVAMTTPGHTPGCITWILSERPAANPVLAGTNRTMMSED